jgi:nitrous oxide reductase accessory protein NosL
MRISLTRREALGAALATFVAGCRRSEARCGFCGMIIDPRSSWNAELVRADGSTVDFDSPRCALLAWRTSQIEARELRVQEYYDRSWKSADEVLFVTSSDVAGPMGADLVPVDPARAKLFAKDHTGTRPLRLSEVTAELLKELH